MNGIFISYRREDTAGHAGRLFDRLAAHFGRSSVFMDVEGIEAGVDFVESIEKAVGGCDVLLAVIGRGWLDSKDSQGNRRLDAPQDFIRIETSSALARNVRVIPVLVEGARMPRAEELPDILRPITRRQALELRDSRWEDDIKALIGVLDRVLSPAAPSRPASAASKQNVRLDVPAWAWKAGAAALLVGGVLLGGTLISNRWDGHEGNAALPPSTVTAAQPVAVLKPATAVQQATPQPETVESVAPPKLAEKKPMPEKPALAKPAVPAAPIRTVAVQPDPKRTEIAKKPAPEPVVTPAPQPQARVAVAAVPPSSAQAALHKVAIIALGEPTYRDFWEGERRAAYSAKIAGLYRDALRDVAPGRIELSVDNDSARDLRGLDRALRETPGLCGTTRAEAVFVARVEESQAISRVESAYWPELRLTAIACDSGKQYSVRDTLSPRRDDGFPFERGMAETMEKFAREYRHLLQ